MTHYVAVIGDAAPDHALGVRFRDLTGCFAAAEAGDNVAQVFAAPNAQHA